MSDAEIQARVNATRAELESTLDLIEDKFNIPKQAGILAKRAQASYEENPTPWIVGAVGVAGAVLGLIAWAIFSDD